MGYSERCCQICGVGFAIGRARTRGEPEEAGWAGWGADYVIDEDPTNPCTAEGCENIDRDGSDEKEHIAGPGCTCTAGYSGHRISVEEMKDIKSCIALLKKPPKWKPEEGDEDFEKEAFSCFLTGISRHVSEFDMDDIHPARHGVNSTMVENFIMGSNVKYWYDMSSQEEWAMPMHPKCFEVFKRASVKKFGKVDLDGLFLLRDEMTDEMTRFTEFSTTPDVEIVMDQWYYHQPGTEYLAANPLNIPGLQAIVEKCRNRTSDIVFAAQGDNKPSTKDPFTSLSPELRLIILNRLEIQDVANLRLASRSFRQLPQSYFHHLIQQQMPWVWELDTLIPQAKDIDWHALWLALSSADGGAQKDEAGRAGLQEARRAASGRLQAELEAKNLHWGNDEFFRIFRERGPNYDEQCEREIMEAYASGKWAKGNKETEVLGLRNRRRVWMDLLEILRRIEVKNEKGLRERCGSLFHGDDDADDDGDDG